MDLSGGLLNEFRLSKRVALNVEVGLNRLETDIDGTEVTNGHRGWIHTITTSMVKSV